MALELELTHKDPKRYRQIMNAYSRNKLISKVIYITRSERTVQTIKDAMRDSLYPKRERPVGFSQVEDWIKDPSRAMIRFGDECTWLEKMSHEVSLASI